VAPLRVLLIDDEEELVSTLVERLKLRGIEVEGVTSGADAIGRVQLVKFDLVVLDMKMPGIGGLEVMRRIRREQPGIKFILMTGRGSHEEGEEGMQEGAFAYLLKPVNIEDLIKKMMEAVGA
jgi:CheY-like chemotaxis protein